MALLQNMFIGIIIATNYCFIFWKRESLGHIKKGTFKYSVFAQSAFLLFYIFISIYLSSNQQNIGINILYIGVLLFYFILYLPLFILVFYTLYNSIKPLEDYSKIIRYTVLGILLLLLIALFIIGLYLFVLFFYGFAP